MKKKQKRRFYHSDRFFDDTLFIEYCGCRKIYAVSKDGKRTDIHKGWTLKMLTTFVKEGDFIEKK